MSARKPDHQRVRRAEPDIPWTDIEVGPRKGPAPKPPKWAAFDQPAKDWWAWAWKLPVSKQWGDEERVAAVRRAELEDRWKLEADTRVLAEMRHLETALGMTPKARRELRWRFVKGADVVEENGVPVPPDELELRRRQAISGRQAV